ncbi:putative late blight resistance protein homolog R1A-3 [Salvia splendens]|uniref:putative late blight resistance protein homolog R1A-3 n=1 Tax=Salvia splendens TaxID=180675 RepID=UPI001C267A9C|nr:putative late blight resistance protein homolog R1A-3 [Salvia splendens]XP_042004998.1 putative late blight resistance protein homolog R1A-3 [Salvia splendens]
MAYEAVDSLQQTLLLILQRDDDVTTCTVKQQIVSIHDKAVALQSSLKHYPEKETIREVAIATEGVIHYLFSSEYLSNQRSIKPYDRVSVPDHLLQVAKRLESTVEYVFDHCKSNDVRKPSAVSSSSRSALNSGVEDLTIVTELIVRNSNWLRRLWGILKSAGRKKSAPSDSPSIPPPTSIYGVVGVAPTNKDVVVGFDDDMIQMRSRLIGHRGRRVLPIVGMARIGKSELAKYIYDDPLMKFHFDIQAWVTISQDYSRASILSQLLASVKGKVDPVGRDSMKVTEAEKISIYKILSGRRYLIVMDDMWSAKAWDCVESLFPHDDNGSWIILTTRLMDVVATDTAPWGSIHKMHFLDDEQSWRLFHHKVFGDQDCPDELRSVGEKIVKGCGGLPLSIVNVAGLLSTIPRTPDSWKQIEGNDEQLGPILSLSYNHLPPQLRKCFLYMSAFPRDYEIHASELIKLWIAECFIEWGNEFVSVEMVAEKCLEDLIKQTLVLITCWKSDGKIKRCRLHSMVWDFCGRQAGEEKFLLPVMDYFPTPILRKHFLPQVLQNHPRISVSWHDLRLRESTHSSCTTSIICIPQRGYRPKCSVQNFTSLRVLHVLRRDDRLYWELGQVFKLIHLTYLASNIPDSIVPPAIAKLRNLQTLIIYRYGVHLPVEIWKLRHLRHLIAFSFRPLLLPERVTLPLKSLKTLSVATNFVCSREMVEMIPNINKLGIFYSEEKFDATYHFDYLISMVRLKKLKLEKHSSFVPRLNFVFPHSLKKLELSGRWISWSHMTIVGSLPHLQVLKLKKYACDEEQWETIRGEFRMLIHLLIDESNLKCWTTKRTHFPRLQCLTLRHCPYLDEIPFDIGEIRTLELIEIDDHNQSLLYSAKKMQEEQQGHWRKEALKVAVKRS